MFTYDVCSLYKVGAHSVAIVLVGEVSATWLVPFIVQFFCMCVPLPQGAMISCTGGGLQCHPMHHTPDYSVRLLKITPTVLL